MDADEAAVLSATGNSLHPGSGRAVMLRASGGTGNVGPGEVHIRLSDGVSEFAQGWFGADDLIAAIEKARDGRVA